MSRQTHDSLKTLPMSVKNTGFLLDRLGQDCHPLQFLRELTQNAIEAIQRTQAPGEVVWDVDWKWFDLERVYKLCVVDTGVGMTGSEMVDYINQLSSSIAPQSLEGNYGVGAKIAAATRNHEGLVYLSWKNSCGAMIHLWRNPADGTYGLKQFKKSDGTYPFFIEVEDEAKPEVVREHGTKIVLLGNAIDANTMAVPPGAAAPSRWIAKYLNSRYFRFPAGITVRAREGWENPRSDNDRNLLRTVTGQETYLREHSSDAGRVDLEGAIAHWWILKDEPALANNSGFIESTGHVAALYQDELYELATGRSGTARLQQFGVIFGYRQVVIYVEPQTSTGNRLTTNTPRTHLLLDNEPLPWADWAIEFRGKMPAAIEALIQAKAAAASATDHIQSIRDRLKQILDLYKLSRYRPTPSGTILIDEDQTGRGGVAASMAPSQPVVSGAKPGKAGGSTGNVYSLFERRDGRPGEQVRPDVFPAVRWISVSDGTREPGDLEDRGAKFIADQNLLLINADFRVFADMIARWHKEFGGNPAVRDVVVDSVHNWFEQALVETVIGVQALQNSKEWSKHDVELALSPEALTTAVMQRYHVNNSVKRELGSKLGKLQPT